MKSKTILKIIIALVAANILCVSAFFIAVNIMKNNSGYETAGYSKTNTESKEKSGTDTYGKTVITLEPSDNESVTKEQLDTAVGVLKKRLTSQGYTEAKVLKYNSGKIKVTVLGADVPVNELSEMLCAEAKLNFTDYQGNAVLDGNDVKSAKAAYDTVSSGSKEYIVKLRLSSAGTKKFAEATEKISGYASGNNYIAIMLDDELITCPSVSAKIDTDECYIQGDFDKSSAKHLADLISSGQLPFSLKITSADTVKPSR